MKRLMTLLAVATSAILPLLADTTATETAASTNAQLKTSFVTRTYDIDFFGACGQRMGSENDWKEFFGLLGVKWPEGSSIKHVPKGKLRVKNTIRNLADFEEVLKYLESGDADGESLADVAIPDEEHADGEIFERRYQVDSSFFDIVISHGNKQEGETGYRRDREKEEKDIKTFFGDMGVKWPEGSRVMFMRTIDQLFVSNSVENHAQLEKALKKLKVLKKVVK